MGIWLYILSVLAGQSWPSPGPGRSPTGTLAIHNPSAFGSGLNNYSGRLGCQFTANQDMTVTQLCRWVLSGNSATHTVTLRDAVYTGILGTVSVPTSGEPVAAYKCVSLGTPVSLTNGTTYHLMSDETDTGDTWHNNVSTTVATTGITITFSTYETGDVPGYSVGGTTYGPVSFRFQ